MANDLIDYYGTECPHCIEMFPLIEKLEKELKVKVIKKEVWHDEKNATELKKADTIGCGGVPFFINKKTGKQLCGAVTYDKLKAWAQGK